MKKTKKFKENRPENYHVHDNGLVSLLQPLASLPLNQIVLQVVVMDMVIFWTIFFEFLVFFTFTLVTFHFAY